MNETMLAKIAGLDYWQSSINIEPLGGGMTNHNFKVTDADREFVVRLGEDDPVHMISRVNETAICHAAFEAGISPELVYSEPGILVSRFIDGKVLEEADVRIDSNLSRIIDILSRFHQKIPEYFHQVPVMFWVFHVLRHYQYLLGQRNNPYRERLVDFAGIATALEQAVGKVNIVFGHNDLLAANFIDDGKKIWLIDFDYAGFNSPLFDLSNLASNNQFSEEQEITMLESYFGAALNLEQWRGYYAMKCASLLRETLWSMVSEIYSRIDVDFSAYTRENLGRFEQAYDSFHHDYL